MDQDKQDALADHFTVRELLGLMPLDQQEALYERAAELMGWDEDGED